jgi:hypothetical protein
MSCGVQLERIVLRDMQWWSHMECRLFILRMSFRDQLERIVLRDMQWWSHMERCNVIVCMSFRV